MKRAGQLFLFITIICWGSIIGGILYSHIAFFPNYLSDLPKSSILVNGEYRVTEEKFWLLIHPITIVCILITLFLNWTNRERRKFILGTAIIYAMAIIATFFYFVPGLMAFSESNKNTAVSPQEWYQRGQRWQQLSWIRAVFMYLGFVLLLIALSRQPRNRA